jgi:prepilin-type N-terminal cleavage/methylation domain-containing protein
MRPIRGRSHAGGFTLIELLVALGIFLIVTGAAFTLLTSSQQRYQTESQVLNSFQEARLGLDQMVRDINDAGFPPPTYKYPVSSTKFNYLTSAPFAWSLVSAGYPGSPCQIGAPGSGGGTCATAAAGDSAPGDFDIIIETNPNYNPSDSTSQVQWIRYQLQGTTLMRGVANKVSGDDPDLDTTAAMVPFVQNVVNNSPGLVIGTSALSASYPGVFSGGSVPVFRYTCDQPPPPPANPQFPLPPTAWCYQAGSDNSPANIRDVIITLIVAAPLPDATTGKARLVQLDGRGRRVNPNQ